MKNVSLRDISNKIYSGGTPNTKNKFYWNGDYNWLSSGETRNPFIYKTERTITKEGILNSSTKLAKAGNIIVASAGQGFTRGQTSLLKIDTYINQSLICIDVNEKVAISEYIFYFLYANYDLLRLISDSSAIRGSLTTKIISEIEIKLPIRSVQQHIVNNM